jgi:predicted MFS family arabinose efflux permease
MESDQAGFDHLPRWRHALAMGALIAAGEAIFFLPFVVARIFRPTLLDVFGLTNFELGLAFSVYGVVAMAAYFAGGFLADRYPANRLMAVALAATALGGLVMVQVPGLGTLKILFGYWGLTTIFLFWAALIRATRMVGVGCSPR